MPISAHTFEIHRRDSASFNLRDDTSDDSREKHKTSYLQDHHFFLEGRGFAKSCTMKKRTPETVSKPGVYFRSKVK